VRAYFTPDWSDYWLNDRELARRPWVYNPASSQVDEVLMETARAAAKLKWRLFARDLWQPLG
jgi:hypothetical protein